MYALTANIFFIAVFAVRTTVQYTVQCCSYYCTCITVIAPTIKPLAIVIKLMIARAIFGPWANALPNDAFALIYCIIPGLVLLYVPRRSK